MSKRVFVTAAVAAMQAAAGIAVWQLATGGTVLAWVGVLLANLPLPLTMAYWMVTRSVSRTSAGFPAVWLPSVLGLVLAGLSLTGIAGSGSWLALGLAAFGVACTRGYIHWYSIFGRTPSAVLAVGQPLPEFSLENAAGVSVSSKSFLGSPAVLMFYRGNWCPLCMAQVKEIAALYRELDARGATVKLVSPQSHRNTQQLSARFDVPFDFLVDPGNATARALGIASPDGIPAGMEVLGYDTDTVMPTVVITDAEGIILMCDETDNYRVRPEPSTFLRVLDQASA